MKYLTALFFGIVSVFVLSFLITPFITEAYISYYDIQPGPDGENELFRFLMYVQWPVFFVFGFFVGYIVHIKCLTKSSKATPKSGAL
jgi:hypothetical protein